MRAKNPYVGRDALVEQDRSPLEQVDAMLSERGIGITASVWAVLVALHAVSDPGAEQGARAPVDPDNGEPRMPAHLEVREVRARLDRRGIHLDQAAMYRAIGRLSHLGLIHRVDLRSHPARYGLDAPAHQHALCRGCGQLRSIPSADVSALLTAAARAVDLELDAGDAMTIHGLCPTCRPPSRSAPSAPRGARQHPSQ